LCKPALSNTTKSSVLAIAEHCASLQKPMQATEHEQTALDCTGLDATSQTQCDQSLVMFLLHFLSDWLLSYFIFYCQLLVFVVWLAWVPRIPSLFSLVDFESIYILWFPYASLLLMQDVSLAHTLFFINFDYV